MAKTGRPPIWDEKLAARICAEIASGTPKSKASVYCGVSEDTFDRWVKSRPAFAAQVQAALKTFTDDLRERIKGGTNAGGFPDWRASAWLLERIDRENYGKADPKATPAVTVNAPVNVTVQISPEQLADLQARRKKAAEELLSGRN